MQAFMVDRALLQMATIKVLILRKHVTQKTSVRDTGKLSSVFNYSNSWPAGVKIKIIANSQWGAFNKVAGSQPEVNH